MKMKPQMHLCLDGTWQRKGFTSTLGAVTAISVDKGKVVDCVLLLKSCKGCTVVDCVLLLKSCKGCTVVDCVLLLKSCKGCTRKEKVRMLDSDSHTQWKANHQCNLNYNGSSPMMEKVGAVKMFERSVETRRLYYTSFYGNGDSKSYSAVKDIYGPTKLVKKFECIGHYQKHIGNRLRKLR